MRWIRFAMRWQAYSPRFSGRIFWPAAAMIALAMVPGWMMAARAQSGTLQVPAQRAADQPTKPPTAAPRQPVHQDGRAGKAATTPVVPPHGPSRPQKPLAAAPAAVPVKPATGTVPDKPASQATPVPPAETAPEAGKPDGNAAKLPRFASLRFDEVNMRAGPGLRYRIDWVYKRRDLPVVIVREFDVWRWVRDPDGIEGWMQQATLVGRRNFIVQKADATLRSEANDTAPAVAILKPGVIGRIRSCEASSAWCNVQTGSHRGYLRREQFWGVLPDEAVGP
jgi:SH3-like domain-containing protein